MFHLYQGLSTPVDKNEHSPGPCVNLLPILAVLSLALGTLLSKMNSAPLQQILEGNPSNFFGVTFCVVTSSSILCLPNSSQLGLLTRWPLFLKSDNLPDSVWGLIHPLQSGNYLLGVKRSWSSIHSCPLFLHIQLSNVQTRCLPCFAHFPSCLRGESKFHSC